VKIARCARKNTRATRAILKKTRALRARIKINPARYARGGGLPKSQNPPWLALTVPGAH